MITLTFKTNINCGSCIRSVTDFIEDIEGVEQWKVNTDIPEKILKVEGDMTAQKVIAAVEEAGFDIELIEQ